VIERLGWREGPALGVLTVIEKSAAAAALHDAWIAGQIPGFPDADHELVLAQRHVFRMDEIEADARSRRLAASQGDDERVGSGQRDPL
jgi:hypothetical protein